MGKRMQPFLKWENLVSIHFIENQPSCKNYVMVKTVESDTPGFWVILGNLYNISEFRFPH